MTLKCVYTTYEHLYKPCLFIFSASIIWTWKTPPVDNGLLKSYAYLEKKMDTPIKRDTPSY